jgi:hypothetical protein
MKKENPGERVLSGCSRWGDASCLKQIHFKSRLGHVYSSSISPVLLLLLSRLFTTETLTAATIAAATATPQPQSRIMALWLGYCGLRFVASCGWVQDHDGLGLLPVDLLAC